MSIITVTSALLAVNVMFITLFIISTYQRKKLKEELRHSEVWGRNHLQLLQKQNKLTLEYRDQVAGAYEQVKEIEEEYKVVRGQHAHLQTIYRNKIDGVDALRENNEQLRGKLSEANEQVQCLVGKYNDRLEGIARLVDENEAYKEQEKDLQEQLDEVAGDLAHKLWDKADVEIDLEAAKEKIKEMEQDEKEEAAISKRLWDDREGLRGANEQLQADLDNVTYQLKNSNGAVAVLQSEMEHLANDIEDRFIP